jgi:holo-[acyl-carrier protein] synthase
MLRTGVDQIEIDRVRKVVERHGNRFLTRVYTAAELAGCKGKIESLAARFAAKEAAAKALGTGIWRNGIRWIDIEVLRDHPSGAPQILLHCAASEQALSLGLTEWSISLSHDRDKAIAFVVALGDRSLTAK